MQHSNQTKKNAAIHDIKSSIEMDPLHHQIVQHILIKYLPPKTQVWVVGSRVQHRARRYSDLDLLIKCGNHAIPYQKKLALQEAFDESDLPYKVDIVDNNDISDALNTQLNRYKVFFIRT